MLFRLPAGKKLHTNSAAMKAAHAFKVQASHKSQSVNVEATLQEQAEQLQNLQKSMREMKNDQEELLSMLRGFMSQSSS
eukprot:COSAG02_NODE_1262_length_13556_cov_11.011522_4_plen_79_part_00